MKYALTEADNGRTLELQVNDDLELSLRDSRMSGYQWTMLESGEPLLAHTDITSPSQTGLLGQTQMRTWQFTAKQAGMARILMRHARSWEPSSGSEFSVNAKISG